MLNNREGVRIAVVVNDMASVNVDAELVRRGGMLQQEEKMARTYPHGPVRSTLTPTLTPTLTLTLTLTLSYH